MGSVTVGVAKTTGRDTPDRSLERELRRPRNIILHGRKRQSASTSDATKPHHFVEHWNKEAVHAVQFETPLHAAYWEMLRWIG